MGLSLAKLDRRRSLACACSGAAALGASGLAAPHAEGATGAGRRVISIFLAGDIMTGRGLDQVMRHSCDPTIHEPYVQSARGYVSLAERANGPIPRRVEPAYIWGEALALLDRRAPDARIINLETAVTTSDDWESKGINYRMHPANVDCLTAARVDLCVLANNHVLDWGVAGLQETLATLRAEGLLTAGAGQNAREAETPATIAVEGGGRVVVIALGSTTSGIPRHWEAGPERPGVNLARALDKREVDRLAKVIAEVRRPGDVVVASIHWGGNWGYEVPREQSAFARLLIDEAGVDVVHGHSSHHPKGIEVYRGKAILYGCGDLLNDYEGIGGHEFEGYRSELSALYLVDVDAESGGLVRLEMVPMKIRRFRLERASDADARWLGRTLDGVCDGLGTRVEIGKEGNLEVRWA